MKKIAIVTLYDDVNIGNKLQNYAVQEICREFGCETESLVNRDMLWDVSWKGKLAAVLGFPRPIAKDRRIMLRRRRRFRVFSKKHLSVSTCSTATWENLRHLNDVYDAFVVGSDQVWHNWKNSKEELDYFFLRFAEEKKRVCFAPSFGFERIPEGFESQYKEGLNGFKYLCCREESGCRLIEQIAGRKAKCLSDPTMFLSAERWKLIASQPEYAVPEKYMLIYCLAEMTPESRTLMNSIAKERKLEIIDVYNLDKPQYYCTTPDEFVYLVEHASYVFTDSFHACVFSILFHRDFSAVVRGDNDGEKMRGRLDTLLKRFGLEGRAAYHACETGRIDYAAADHIAALERESGIEFIRRALEDACAEK